MIKAAAHHLMAQEHIEPVSEGSKRSIGLALSRMLDRTVFGGSLIVLVLFAIPYGAVEPWWEAAFECAVFTLTGLWIIEGAISGSWRVYGWHLMLPLLALVIFAFAQSWDGPGMLLGGVGKVWQPIVWQPISADPYTTRQFAYKLLALILIGAILLSHTSTPHRLRLLIVVILGVGVMSAFFGILRQTVQREDGFILAYLRHGEGFAQFINRNHFAFLMEMTLGLVLGLMVGGGIDHERLLIYFAVGAPIWAGLVLSNSRGAICSLLGQVLFLAVMCGSLRPIPFAPERGWSMVDRLGRVFRSLLVRAVLIIGMVAAISIGIFWMGGDPLAGRLESLSGEIRAEGDSVRRLNLWAATWELIKENPIAGIGFDAYWVAINRYHRASGELVPREAHNDYLELLASGGVIGAVLAAWFMIALILTARRKLRTGDGFNKAACLGALIGLFGVAIHSFVDFGLHITINAAIFASLATIITLDN
jgi:putative inorganic carbon (hco3(-)) transporter